MNKTEQILLLSLVILAVVLPRTLHLSVFQTADEKRWVANTTGFITNLAHGDLAHLMQQPHPGITTQWIGSATVFSPSWTVRKLPLVLSQSLLVLAIGYIFWRLLGKTAALFITLMLALNPLLIAHTRVYAMDSLLALFSLLALTLLFLWSKTNGHRYLVLAAFFAAAAVMSKLPGLIIVPSSYLIILYLYFINRHTKHPPPTLLYPLLIWSLSFIISSILILPSLAFNPHLVLADVINWFSSDDYQLHQQSPAYYIGSLIFFTTPLHYLTLPLIPLLLYKKRLPPLSRRLVIVLITFSLIFLLFMSLGAKKGDRYLLPVFLALDAITALIVTWFLSQDFRRWSVKIFALSVLSLLGLQITQLISLHPYYLAYVNPISSIWLNERRLGWGEGLDLAADYLNQLPTAANLTVASYYPNEFQTNFAGHAVPVHQHDDPAVNYVIVYRAMFERGPGAWETDVVNQYRPRTPIKIISLGSTPMVWIYQK